MKVGRWLWPSLVAATLLVSIIYATTQFAHWQTTSAPQTQLTSSAEPPLSTTADPAEPVDQETAEPTKPPPAQPSWWRPSVGTSFQWQLAGEIDESVDASVFVLDWEETPPQLVKRLQSQGKRVVCYVSVGSWENYRADADQFPQAIVGTEYVGYPDERWLDIRATDTLSSLIGARFDTCTAKGFDGVDADNVDGYQQETGFPLTTDDQLRFNRWLADQAHQRNLAIGLKNDPDQVPNLVTDFDFAVVEECFHQGWCEQLTPFIQAGKPVAAIEYTDTDLATDQFCPKAAELGISAVLKHRSLDTYRSACPTP